MLDRNTFNYLTVRCLFYDISTLVGYSMPNEIIYIYCVCVCVYVCARAW